MKNSIEIAGTLLSLDDIAAVSSIQNAGINYPDYFTVVYKSYQGRALSFSVIDRCVESEQHFMLMGDEIKIYIKDISINEIRDKIIKIINTNE